MRNRFERKIAVRHAWSIIIFFMIGIFVSSFSVEAASKGSQAKKAYRNLLSSYKTNPEYSDYAKNEYAQDNFTFALCDLTGDGIPELILRESSVDPYVYWIYTYRNGKVKKLKKMDYYNGGMLYGIYPKTHIVCASEGNSYDNDFIYYKLGKGKIKTIARTKDKKYYIQGKKVSKSKYKKYVTRLKKGKKVSEDNGKLKFWANTVKNRNKYLK